MSIATSPYSYSEYASLALMAATAVTLVIIALKSPRYASAAVPGLGSLMGAAYFIAIHGTRVLDTQQIHWLRGDSLDHFLGWHMFRHAPWQVPPGRISTLIYPVGTSIGNTDSIPFLALLFKPFDAALPTEFQYIGLALLCAFTLQGAFGVLLVRTVTPYAPLQLAGAALLVLSPNMLYRLGHPALVNHWLLLAGLWLYMKPQHAERTSARLAAWGILVAIAAAIHPYLCAMLFGLACAAYGRWAMALPRHRLHALMALVILAIDITCVWWLVGYFLVRPGDLQGVGMDEFSMNLLAYVTPMTASAVLPEIPIARGGQYEGFNYLGLGVIVLVAIAGGALLRRLPSRAAVLPLVPLVVVVLLCSAYALSNQVTAGVHVLFELPHQLWSPFAAFRATGRFGWPGHYLVVFLVVAVVVRRFGTRAATACLCGALVLQVVDLLPLQLAQRDYRRRPESYIARVPSLASDFWREAVPRYKHLTLWPSHYCLWRGLVAADRYEPYVLLAGRYRLTINDGGTSRYDGVDTTRYCQQLEADIVNGVVSDDHVYIMQAEHRQALFEIAREPLVCFALERSDVCVTLESMKRWPSHYRGAGLTPAADRGRETMPATSGRGRTQADGSPAPSAGPSAEELIQLYDRLDRFYRESLGRLPVATAVTDALAAATLRDYLNYRLAACAHRGAANRALLALEGFDPPDCPVTPSAGRLPARNETLEFRRELEAARRARNAPERLTYVDPEEEVAWTLEYVRYRLQECTPREASDAVIATIQGRGTPDCP